MSNRRFEQQVPPDVSHLGSKERRQKMIEFEKELDKASAAMNKLVLVALTPEQRVQFEKLQGKKIEVTWPYDELTPMDDGF